MFSNWKKKKFKNFDVYEKQSINQLFIGFLFIEIYYNFHHHHHHYHYQSIDWFVSISLNYYLNIETLWNFLFKNFSKKCMLNTIDKQHIQWRRRKTENNSTNQMSNRLMMIKDSKTAIPVKITAIVDYNQVGFSMNTVFFLTFNQRSVTRKRICFDRFSQHKIYGQTELLSQQNSKR